MNGNEQISLIKLLEKKLKIPEYQRPYEWNKYNVYTLLEDIMEKYKENLDINLGAIILFKGKNTDNYEIVDGLQRIITLSLLLKFLDIDININLLNEKILCISNTEERILNNYNLIEKFINKLDKNENIDKTKFYSYLKNNVKFFLLESSNYQESFQLFDGRNSKYKDLTPIDLLKAYHLGEIPEDYPIENKIKLLSSWKKNIEESFEIDESINKNEYLINNMLFNIYNWSLNKNIRDFTKNDIYLYKGYNKLCKYKYVKYYESNNNIFQINKPFPSGEGFFNMINYYVNLVDKIIKENNLEKKLEISTNQKQYFKYINYLYYDAILLFYDKFGEEVSNFQKEMILDFILTWSVAHRINNQLVSTQSINNYVLNTKFNFFFECDKALKVEELLKIEELIIGKPNKSEILGELRSKLWEKLNYVKD